jgi:hypothetical protein
MKTMSSFVEFLNQIVLGVLGEKKEYIISAIEDYFPTSNIQVGLEVFLEGGVDEFLLEGSAVGQPIAEEQFAAVHPVVAGVLEVEDAHAGLLGREAFDELGPVPLAIA